MNDLEELAYELGDLMGSMPLFLADFINYSWKDQGEVYELWFEVNTGKWRNSPNMIKAEKSFRIVNKIAQPKAYELRDKMTKIVEANNDN